MKKKMLFTTLAFAGLMCFTSCQGNKGANDKSSNPFLSEYTTPYQIPPFDKISYADYEPALDAGIEQQNAEIDSIIKNAAEPNFDNTILALDNSGEILNRVQYVFFALSSSDNTPEMQQLAEKLQPKMTAQSDAMFMNDSLFQKVKYVQDNADKLQLDPVQKRLTDKYYKRFVRNGALLTPQQKDTLKDINKQMAALSLKFTNNVMHDMDNCVIWVDKEEDLSGLPQATKDAAAALAKEKKNQGGKWAFTATGATRLAVLTYADNRDLRKQMYETYTSTASHGDQWDNTANINGLIKLRQQKARLLGFKTFADYAIDPYMAHTVANAEGLLMQLWRPAIKKVEEEVADMQAYADAHGDSIKLDRWDYYYYAEKVKKEKFNFSEDDVRPYFCLDSVVQNGIFFIANKLYGLTFTEMPDAPKYNPEVKVYDVKDENGKHLAVFMTDYFPRATKAQGAWMSEFQSEYCYKGDTVRPIIFNVASMTPPSGDTPSLLTWDEVQTVFHEFGHALHGMLTTAPFRGLSGTNVDRDLVEMPSQINEHWAFEPAVLQNYARHYKTGEVIPDSLVKKLNESAQFNMGFMTTELVGAALLDIEWHKLNWTGDVNIKEFEQQVAQKLGMPAIVEFRYRSPYFKHIFDNDQYSSGYYTYLWAQVLEADGYQKFEQMGALNKEAADSYRHNILEMGDTEDPMVLYKRFRGHEPSPAALLRNRGLQ